MILSKQKAIFIHIPKTGGNSIHDAMRDWIDDDLVRFNESQDGVERFGLRNQKYPNLVKHATLSDYRVALGDRLDEYRIFATLRNPFEKIVSFYFSPHMGRSAFDISDFKRFASQVAPLDHYLEGYEGNSTLGQSEAGKVTFLRFETLAADFKSMCEELSLPTVELPHRNAGKSVAFRDCFDAELRQWVESIHKLELSLGNYQF